MMVLGMILAMVVAGCAEYRCKNQHEELRLTSEAF